jgi:hypothetical protein
MPQGRISKRSVDALTCPARKDREFFWDDALAGFGVGAFPSGKKVYVVQYRQDGRSRRANGEHGRLIIRLSAKRSALAGLPRKAGERLYAPCSLAKI